MSITQSITETLRLLLRRFEGGDLDVIAELLGDEQVMRFSTGVKTREQSRHWLGATIAGYDKNDWGHWAVVTREEGTAIGFCGLKQFDIEGQIETEIGYRYLPAWWGRGFGVEAASAVRDLGFGRFGFQRLISLVEPGNIGSCKVAERVGMRHERTVEKWGKQLYVYALGAPGTQTE